jgi:hypothetical protein
MKKEKATKKKCGRGVESRHLEKCPKCGKRCGAPIFWGYPAPEDRADMEQGARDGRLVFGGCCISGDEAKWECTSCEHRWGRLDYE